MSNLRSESLLPCGQVLDLVFGAYFDYWLRHSPLPSSEQEALLLNTSGIYQRLDSILPRKDIKEATGRAVSAYGSKTIAQRIHSLLIEENRPALKRAAMYIFNIVSFSNDIQRQLVGLKTHFTMVEHVWEDFRKGSDFSKILEIVIGPIKCLDMLFAFVGPWPSASSPR